VKRGRRQGKGVLEQFLGIFRVFMSADTPSKGMEAPAAEPGEGWWGILMELILENLQGNL
jgi:hypothetical protein